MELLRPKAGMRISVRGCNGTISYTHQTGKKIVFGIKFDKGTVPESMEMSEDEIQVCSYWWPFNRCECGAESIARGKMHYVKPSKYEHALWCEERNK